MRRNHGLTFLLSLAGLPIACGPEKTMSTGGDGDSDGTTGTEGGDTGAVTTGMLGQGGGGTGDETGTAGPPVNPACVAYYATMLECFPDEGVAYAAVYAAYCDRRIDLGLKQDGQACADAWAAGYVCMSKLPCNILVGDDAPHCVAEFDAAVAACPTPVDDG
jgi:hypothetical protein